MSLSVKCYVVGWQVLFSDQSVSDSDKCHSVTGSFLVAVTSVIQCPDFLVTSSIHSQDFFSKCGRVIQ